MKAIFPCKGTIILNKQDLEPLKAFYKSELMRSQMYDFYRNSKDILQVNNFTYIPQGINIILNKDSLLELNTLKEVLGIKQKTSKTVKPSSTNIPEISPTDYSEVENPEDDLIDDGDILSNPFFTTLKPLD